MAKNITLLGASYPSVPAVLLPRTEGGTAKFTDTSDSTSSAGTMLNGTIGYDATGARVTGNVVIQHYYTGSGTPSSSLGNNGDVYLEVV